MHWSPLSWSEYPGQGCPRVRRSELQAHLLWMGGAWVQQTVICCICGQNSCRSFRRADRTQTSTQPWMLTLYIATSSAGPKHQHFTQLFTFLNVSMQLCDCMAKEVCSIICGLYVGLHLPLHKRKG